MLDKICPICSVLMIQIETDGLWDRCNCGTRKMNKDFEIINLENYITANGSYTNRLKSEELTPQVKDNAIILLNMINQLLRELGIKEAKVSSGFRPSGVNSNLSNAAKKSLHMVGSACDILDNTEQSLGNLIKSRPDLLKKYGLWMEDLDSTRGKFTNWVHLDLGVRPDREIRIFHP